MEKVALSKPAWLPPPLVAHVPHISLLEVLYCGKWTHFWLSKHCRKSAYFLSYPFSFTMFKWLHSWNLLCHPYFCIRTNTLKFSYPPFPLITATNQYYLVLCLVIYNGQIFGNRDLIGCLGSEKVEREVELLISWVLPPSPWVGNWHISNFMTHPRSYHASKSLAMGTWTPSSFKSPVLFKLVWAQRYKWELKVLGEESVKSRAFVSGPATKVDSFIPFWERCGSEAGYRMMEYFVPAVEGAKCSMPCLVLVLGLFSLHKGLFTVDFPPPVDEITEA